VVDPPAAESRLRDREGLPLLAEDMVGGYADAGSSRTALHAIGAAGYRAELLSFLAGLRD
jgi:hypothetical protein